MPNSESAKIDEGFVDSTVKDLLAAGCIEHRSDRPHVCSPLIVVTSRKGKKRLVINLRYVNDYLIKEKFKYEDMRTACNLFQKGDFLLTFDLKSGYHHIGINQGSQTFLGFEWRGEFFVFTVLPFGLSTACFVFTKALRPLVKMWRKQGIRMVLYIDDGIVLAASTEEAAQSSIMIRDTLSRAGLVLQPEKCNWSPSHTGQWLGFQLDLLRGSISVPHDKIKDLQHRLKVAIPEVALPAKAIASIVGRIISMSIGLGPICRFRTRALYALLDSRRSWFDVLSLNEEARAELNFWNACLEYFNGQSLWQSPSTTRVVYSDASDTGFGGYIVEHGPLIAHGQWTEGEAKQSSTWRELKAVAQVLESVVSRLKNERVKWFTDNQNVARILLVGSKKEYLQEIALKVFGLIFEHNIKLEPEWVPRGQNEMADYISRIIDYDDWGINQSVFELVDEFWGPHTVDRFASDCNNKCVRFNSRFWNPGSEAVDAFTVNWAGELNWFCPPIVLIPRVVAHARACGCKGTLVVPAWPSAPFWPLLFPWGGVTPAFIQEVWPLPLFDNVLVPGRSGAVLFKGNRPTTDILAIQCDFSSVH